MKTFRLFTSTKNVEGLTYKNAKHVDLYKAISLNILFNFGLSKQVIFPCISISP